ncbi:unnamed protein product [Acanthocheilonema viteae]|uniref:Uncharacterized protein n=1 Tax=Acanthocheilonema viteae TaxID=6277 RepID=A0A498SM14_ACAVI|nr:unnamed protein product [Acanthocheilonema viteae]
MMDNNNELSTKNIPNIANIIYPISSNNIKEYADISMCKERQTVQSREEDYRTVFFSQVRSLSCELPFLVNHILILAWEFRSFLNNVRTRESPLSTPEQHTYLTATVAAAALVANFPLISLLNHFGIRFIFTIPRVLSSFAACILLMAIICG